MVVLLIDVTIFKKTDIILPKHTDREHGYPLDIICNQADTEYTKVNHSTTFPVPKIAIGLKPVILNLTKDRSPPRSGTRERLPSFLSRHVWTIRAIWKSNYRYK